MALLNQWIRVSLHFAIEKSSQYAKQCQPSTFKTNIENPTTRLGLFLRLTNRGLTVVSIVAYLIQHFLRLVEVRKAFPLKSAL
eukprot:610994-Rhodomonas_salina.2